MDQAVFMRGETWGFDGQAVEHMETHAAHVFLVGDRAFKMKKPVKLPYLDFSTIEKRKAVLEYELEINRAFAPSLYLRNDEIRGEPVLVMKRFDQLALLSSHSRGITDATAKELASMVAASHVIAPQRETSGSEIMKGLGAQLSKAFADSPDIFQADEAREFQVPSSTAFDKVKPAPRPAECTRPRPPLPWRHALRQHRFA